MSRNPHLGPRGHGHGGGGHGGGFPPYPPPCDQPGRHRQHEQAFHRFLSAFRHVGIRDPIELGEVLAMGGGPLLQLIPWITAPKGLNLLAHYQLVQPEMLELAYYNYGAAVSGMPIIDPRGRGRGGGMGAGMGGMPMGGGGRGGMGRSRGGGMHGGPPPGMGGMSMGGSRRGGMGGSRASGMHRGMGGGQGGHPPGYGSGHEDFGSDSGDEYGEFSGDEDYGHGGHGHGGGGYESDEGYSY